MMNTPSFSLKTLFWDLLKPYSRLVIAMCCMALFWAFENAFSPYVLKLIIDKVAAFEGDRAQVLAAVRFDVILYLGLWVAIAVDMRLLDWVKLQLFPSIRYDIITQNYAYLNQHSYRYFQSNFAGSLANKIVDMNSSVITILTTWDDTFAQAIGLIIAIIAMMLVHPIFAGILLGWAIVFISVAMIYFKPIHDLSLVFATAKTSVMGKMVDSITNVTNIRLFSRSKYENTMVSDAMRDTVAKDRAMQWTILKMRIYWDVSIVLLLSINLWLLVVMYRKHQVSVGDFSFIISLSISIFYNLWYLASQFVVFAEELGKCRQAVSILSEPHEITDMPEAKPLVVSKGIIEFVNVSFHYEKRELLFNNKSVLIPAGQKVGLVGLSGSGKSTFVNVILRLFEVTSGQILIDGQDIRAVTQASLRENIAMIPQDVSLFHRSLLDNIRYGRIDAPDDEVIAASINAHCHEFISQLPLGYETLVGERGIKLSGGQRQRIAIARAMLKNAPILILDEATSALDSLTEQLIQEGLHTLMQGRTTIVIAHRLSTLAEMDRILVFDKGRIIEDGTHSDLLTLDGHYSHMWRLQAGGFLPDKL